MTSENIIQMAFDLGNALAQTQEIEQLKNMQEKLNNDQHAYDLIISYQEARMKLDEQQKEGKIVSQNDENHLQILEDQLTANETVIELMQAQEKFDNLMQAVYFAINQAIAGNDDCSSGCDSCSGCGTM